MRQAETAARIEAHLRELPWPTAVELADDLHLSAATVRNHLNDLVLEGKVERRADESHPSPRGSTDRFNLLSIPLGPVIPTAELLCENCVKTVYGDMIRYQHARTRTESDETNGLEDDAYDRYLLEARCGRCGNLRYP